MEVLNEISAELMTELALTVREVTSVEEFSAVASDWDAVAKTAARPNLFLTHAWLHNWWQCHEDDDRQLLAVLVYAGNRVIGIAPFMKSTGRMMGLPVRRIEFLTMNAIAASPANCSGTLDITATCRHDEVIACVLQHLRKNHRWDYLRLHPLPEHSRTIGILERDARSYGMDVRSKSAFANSCLHMEQGWEQFTGTLSKQFKRTMRQHEQKLLKLGNVKFVEYRTPLEVEVMYNDVLEIEKASWKWGKGVAINSVAFRDFYKRFAIEAARNGWMRLWMLELDGRNIAYDYCVMFHGSVLSLKKSYRTDYREYFPGGLLESHSFESMAGEGATTIDLLWGDEDYKKKWAPVMEEHVEVTLFNSTVYARFLENLFFKTDITDYGQRTGTLIKRGLRFVGMNSDWSELTREDQIEKPVKQIAREQRAFAPGTVVRIKPVKDLLTTLDDAGACHGVVLLPEMLKLSGQIFRVKEPAPPPGSPVPNAPAEAMLLQGACCDGSNHGGCPKACLFMWRSEWLEEVHHQAAQDIGLGRERLPAATPVAEHSGQVPCQCGPVTDFGSAGFVGLSKLVRIASGEVHEHVVVPAQK